MAERACSRCTATVAAIVFCVLLWRSGGDGINSSNSNVPAVHSPGSSSNDTAVISRLERAVTSLELEAWMLKRALQARTASSPPPPPPPMPHTIATEAPSMAATTLTTSRTGPAGDQLSVGVSKPAQDDVVITMLGTLGLGVGSRFVRSLREVGAVCEIVLIMPKRPSSVAIAETLAEFRVQSYYYPTSGALYQRLHGNREKLVRYWAARDYLRSSGTRHRSGRVLLADSRDVLFQRDPFTIPASRGEAAADTLDVFMEDYLRDFKNSGINQVAARPLSTWSIAPCAAPRTHAT